MSDRHEAEFLDGRPINFNNPPAATKIVRWSKRDVDGRVVKGSLRTICHLNRLNNLSLKKHGVALRIIQPPFNTDVPASAGTHDFDCCVDLYIAGIDWHKQQRFFRANGLGCWYRHPPLFGNHIHGFTLPLREGVVHEDDFATRVGSFVPGQLADYYNHAFGLKDQHTTNSDQSWFPNNIDATIFDLQRYIRARAS